MLKSTLTERLAKKFTHLPVQQTSIGIDQLIEKIVASLCQGERIEIRGFGSFQLRYHQPRNAHNPQTGTYLVAKAKHRPHFKPSKELKLRVDK